MSDPDERVDLERLDKLRKQFVFCDSVERSYEPYALGLIHAYPALAAELRDLRDRKLLWEEVEEADNRHLEKMEQQRYDLRTANARLRAECEAGRAQHQRDTIKLADRYWEGHRDGIADEQTLRDELDDLQGRFDALRAECEAAKQYAEKWACHADFCATEYNIETCDCGFWEARAAYEKARNA